MTKKERGQYAALCSHLQAEARKNGTHYTKPERPDAYKLESLEAVAKTSKRNLRTLNYRMNVITQQMDMLVDFITELYQENPQYREYFKIVDYLACSLYEIEETLKTL